jgi:phospholipase/lecithinase/hemolysin
MEIVLEEILNSYQNGNEVSLVETEKLFKTVKQSPASFGLTPVQFYSGSTITSDGYYTNKQTHSQLD